MATSSSLAPWLGLLALSKSEKATIANIQSMASSFGLAAVGGKLGLPKILSAARGEEEPPEWLLKLANQYSRFRNNETLFEAGFNQLLIVLQDKGAKLEDLVSLTEKLAPMLEVDLDNVEDQSKIVLVMDKIVSNVQDADTTQKHVGIIVCPKCQFTHLV